jgi:hypothetical protein
LTQGAPLTQGAALTQGGEAQISGVTFEAAWSRRSREHSHTNESNTKADRLADPMEGLEHGSEVRALARWDFEHLSQGAAKPRG